MNQIVPSGHKGLTQETPVHVQTPNLSTLSVEVKAIRVGKKQVTQAVFRQLEKRECFDRETLERHGTIWGWVNYFWGTCNKDHLHIVWHREDNLYRDCVYRNVYTEWEENHQSSINLLHAAIICVEQAKLNDAYNKWQADYQEFVKNSRTPYPTRSYKTLHSEYNGYKHGDIHVCLKDIPEGWHRAYFTETKRRCQIGEGPLWEWLKLNGLQWNELDLVVQQYKAELTSRRKKYKTFYKELSESEHLFIAV
jgi:hypothetical protein